MPFTVDFPLARFGLSSPAFDFGNVGAAALVLQAGNSYGGSDFVIRSIEVY